MNSSFLIASTKVSYAERNYQSCLHDNVASINNRGYIFQVSLMESKCYNVVMV